MRCSTVPMETPLPSPIVVHMRVSTTRSQRAGIGVSWARSVRRKTMPASTGAGLSVNCTGLPECRPTPMQLTDDFSVRWVMTSDNGRASAPLPPTFLTAFGFPMTIRFRRYRSPF